MAVVVVPASAGGTNGGSGVGSSGGSSGYCLSCAIMPLASSPIGLLAIGGLLGLIVSLAVVTMSARSSLENTKRRMKRLTRYEGMLTFSQYLSAGCWVGLYYYRCFLRRS